MSTLSALTSIVGADLADGDLLLVRDISGTPTDKKITVAELMAKVATSTSSIYQAVSAKDQPNGYAGLNGDGQLVGPIILADYADNTAAGARDEGEIFTVDGELRIGDGSTNGGLPVASAPDLLPDVYGAPANPAFLTSNTSLNFDTTKNETVVGVYGSVDLTISNFNSVGLGHRLTLFFYVDGAYTLNVKNNLAANVISISGLANGVYCYQYMNMGTAEYNDIFFGWALLNSGKVADV